MSFDAHKNLSYSTVATAPSPASSGTSLVVQAGDGTKFPTAPFNATVWPAGAQPTTANAEIVRVTNVSTDTFTITRAQESTSARSIVTGDQIAATITVKTFTDIEGSVNPSVVVAAAPTGVGATDNANIAAAITACPAGGIVQLQAGTYALGTSGITISKTLTLRGTGGADGTWANFGTLLTLDSATAVAITTAHHGVKFENFALQNVHSTAPTAGAGLQTTSGGGNSTHYGPNLSVKGFYLNIDHQAGYEWFMDPSCFLYDFVHTGLKIQNVDSTDSADCYVSGVFVAGPNNNASQAIQWLSGGGLRLDSIKINTRSSKTLTVGVDIEVTDGITTSDILLTNSSIENCQYGFLVETNGGSHTGVLGNIVVSGNEFYIGGSSSATGGVVVSPSAASQVTRVNVLGNVFFSSSSVGTSGISFTNVSNASHGPNVFSGFGSAFNDGGGNTTLTSVGAG